MASVLGEALGPSNGFRDAMNFPPFSSYPRAACRDQLTRRAQLCQPAVRNEQSYRRDIVSLWALWHLRGASVLAPPRCDNTRQVAVLITNNPKVQNGQRSSPNFLP